MQFNASLLATLTPPAMVMNVSEDGKTSFEPDDGSISSTVTEIVSLGDSMASFPTAETLLVHWDIITELSGAHTL